MEAGGWVVLCTVMAGESARVAAPVHSKAAASVPWTSLWAPVGQEALGAVAPRAVGVRREQSQQGTELPMAGDRATKK